MPDASSRSLADPSNPDAGPLRLDMGHGGEGNRWACHPEAAHDPLPEAGPNAGPSAGARFYLASRALWVQMHRAGVVRSLSAAADLGVAPEALGSFLAAPPVRT